MAVTASRARDFVQSIGVCAHIEQSSPSSYATSDVASQMAYLGIGHMRVTTPYNNLATFQALGALGVKFDVIPVTTDLSAQMALIDEIAPYVELVEGPNEVNTDPVSYKGLTQAAAADAFQADLYSAIHSDPLLAGVKVLSFSLSVGGSLTGYGNVSAAADSGNVHGYASQGVPPYYMLNYAVSSVTTTPGKPVIMTETGYYTANDGQSGVSQDVQAKWLIDTLLQNSADGVVRTYLYQLEDAYTDPASDPENHWGLFNVDGTPKQAATDIHNLTTILADPGSGAATFTPGTLDYTVSGLSPDFGFQKLFAKSNGSFDIALWSEPQFYDTATSSAATVPASAVTIALGGLFDVDVFDPVIGTAAVAHYDGVSSVSLALATDPIIVEVQQVGPLPPPGSPVTLGTGPNSVVVGVSEDAWQGDADFTLQVDGQQIGGVQTATALHGAGKSQLFTVLGTFGAGPHTLTATFLNDAYGGSAATDRNLYVDSIAAGGVATSVGAAMLSDGAESFSFYNPYPAAPATVVLDAAASSGGVATPKPSAALSPYSVFDASYYLRQNPDVAAAGMDPLAHFEQYGWREGRAPSLVFDDAKYLSANPDVNAAGVDPLLHYIQFGHDEGRATFLPGGTLPADPMVNPAYYDSQLGATLIPTGVAASQQAAWSYDTTGWKAGLNPDAWFDTSYYLSHNPDVAAAGVDPLQHYETYGWREGRDPSAQFSTSKYLAAYADVKAANVDPLLHYIEYGQNEGRSIFHV